MIIDLQNFITKEKAYWDELEGFLKFLEEEPLAVLSLEKLERLHYLYERTSADLGQVSTFASEPEIRHFLENLVARAYGEIHEVRGKPHRFDPKGWFFKTFPQTFRRHLGAFWIALATTLAGVAFGATALALDPDAKGVLMPFEHLQMSPQERVRQEEAALKDRLAGHKAGFSTFLMTHNIQVSIMAFTFGVTWGLGSLFVMFQNGLMLGAVVLDYVRAGETKFLIGWLLPHGSFEIPAILLAGQAGLVLAGAMIGWRKPLSFRERMKAVSGDLMTFVFGFSIMLVWAGFVESFLSQYHEPVLPYEIKIAFGCVELALLTCFLCFSGRVKRDEKGPDGAND